MIETAWKIPGFKIGASIIPFEGKDQFSCRLNIYAQQISICPDIAAIPVSSQQSAEIENVCQSKSLADFKLIRTFEDCILIEGPFAVQFNLKRSSREAEAPLLHCHAQVCLSVSDHAI